MDSFEPVTPRLTGQYDTAVLYGFLKLAPLMFLYYTRLNDLLTSFFGSASVGKTDATFPNADKKRILSNGSVSKKLSKKLALS